MHTIAFEVDFLMDSKHFELTCPKPVPSIIIP